MTTRPSHAKVKEAFTEALGLEADARRAFLDDLREREPDLAAEVSELLGHHDPDDTFLEESVLDRLPDEAQDAEKLVGQRVGRFTITRLIASGSMGAVYEAEQDEPKRAVAVKVLRAGAMSPRALRRFRYEAEVLALLRHPGVAQIYEAGAHSDGALSAPYFAMELIPDARAVTRYARESALLLDARLALFIKICGAVHHGHQKGVIHRDLKPANLLVGASGQPKVIDFGVARAVDAEPGGTVGTLGGQLVGTLQYMSPEQLRPGGDDIDVRTDIYALGVVLYELVCDRPPHDLDGLSLVEAADLLRRKRVPRAGSINPDARGDLEAIIAKATEPERVRRYQSAEALAADIARYLRNEPVEASRSGLWRQFTLFAKRRAGTVAAASAVAAMLIIATLVSLSFAVAAERSRAAEVAARNDAQRSTERAERVVTLLRDMISLGETGAAASVENMLDEAVTRLDDQLDEDPLVEASLRLAIGEALHRRARFADAEPQLRQALAAREELLGPDATETLEVVSALALTLAERGALDDATALAERLEDAVARDQTGDPARLASALLTRAELARRLGFPAQAADYYARARRVLEPNSPEWLRVRVAEGEIALDQRRPERALEAFRDFAARAAGAPPELTRRVARLTGAAMRLSGETQAAQRRLRGVVDINRADLGPREPETLLAQLELELALGSGSDILRELESGAAAVLDPPDPALSSLRLELARALQREERYLDAVDVLKKRVSGLTHEEGRDRPGVVGAIIDTADAMRRAGQLSQASSLSLQIRSTAERLFPEGAIPRARVVVILGEIERDSGRDLVRDDELVDAAEALAAQLGPAHPLAVRAGALLASAGRN